VSTLIEIPERAEPIIGTPDEGTRIFRKEAPEEEAGHWFDALDELFGPLVSPGGVSMYAPVSRAAVHKRVQEGKITAFCFHITEKRKGWFGRLHVKRESPYVLIPVSEAKAWRQELEERALKQGKVTPEELEGSKPDWHGEFWEWNERRRK
jgi:hypothetical protein